MVPASWGCSSHGSLHRRCSTPSARCPSAWHAEEAADFAMRRKNLHFGGKPPNPSACEFQLLAAFFRALVEFVLCNIWREDNFLGFRDRNHNDSPNEHLGIRAWFKGCAIAWPRISTGWTDLELNGYSIRNLHFGGNPQKNPLLNVNLIYLPHYSELWLNLFFATHWARIAF